MISRLSFRPALPAALIMLALSTAAPAQQQSASYKFLQAVRNAKGDEVTKMLQEPGSTILNTHDESSGEGALHIVVRRGDATYLRFLLAQPGIDPNIRDKQGNTPLGLAVNLGQDELVDILANSAAKTNVDRANGSGETPLILAVHNRNIPIIRILLKAGADPDITDHIAGLSAREYARQDTRAPAMAKLLDETPKKTRAAVAGPKF